MASTRQPTRPQPARQRPAPRGATYRPPPFTQRGLYRHIRHPLMAGFVIIFWAASAMTLGHLLFARRRDRLHRRRHHVRGA